MQPTCLIPTLMKEIIASLSPEHTEREHKVITTPSQITFLVEKMKKIVHSIPSYKTSGPGSVLSEVLKVLSVPSSCSDL